MITILYYHSLSSYASAKEAKSYPYWGVLGLYEGGGYLADLSSTLAGALQLVKQLRQANWTDEFTRAVLLQLNVYNANSNLFSLLTIAYEFPPSGGAFVRYTTETVALYRYNAALGVIALVAEIACILVFVISVGRVVIAIIEERCSFFHRIGHWGELLSIVFYVAAISCYIYRSVWTVYTVEEMMNNPGNLNHILNSQLWPPGSRVSMSDGFLKLNADYI